MAVFSKPSTLLTPAETGDVIDGLSISLSAVAAKEKVGSIVTISEIVAHEIIKPAKDFARPQSPENQGDYPSVVASDVKTGERRTVSVASSVSTLYPGTSEEELAVDENNKVQADYWSKAFADVPASLELPTDRPHPLEPASVGAEYPFQIGTQLEQLLTSLSEEHDLNLATSILVGWSIVLSRLSGQEDILVGVCGVGEKASPSVALPVRINLSGEPNTLQLLGRVRDVLLAAGARGTLSQKNIAHAVHSWQGKGSLSPKAAFYLYDGEANTVPLDSVSVPFDIELHLHDTPEGTFTSLRYPPALFDTDTIKRYAGYLIAVLMNMFANSGQSVATIDIISPAEKKLVLKTWNDTSAEYPADRCVQRLFEEQVEKSPEAIAIVHEDQSFTYLELDALADRIAHKLVHAGIKQGDFVATLLLRSVELVAAQLAVLKIGAAYVPVDPKAPVDRQAFIVEDSASRLLITDIYAEVASELKLPLLRIDIGELQSRDEYSGEITLTRSSQDTAYVMYTSGSTGRPKGVLVPHKGIARLVINNGFATIRSDDRVVFAANPAFDASTFEVWAPLLNGGTIVTVDSDTVADPYRFASVLEQHKITVLFMTPVMLNQHVLTIGSSLAKLRYLISGGEQASTETYIALLRHKGPVRLLNAYGPTEATMLGSTYEACGGFEKLEKIPIGKPIGNTYTYVLDKHAKPVPMGAVGELYIGGDGVANGYLNRPELTMERFIPDPFSKTKGARLYRSGDLVRHLPDGNIVFMGRNDDQVKVRGFRIELGEIEARLVEHDLVRESVVLALGEGSEKRLVAYVVAEPTEGLAHTLRSHIEERLPVYMIPAAFVRLDAIPVTANGKVDRRALPEPQEDAFARQEYEAPRGETEEAIAAIWSELLGVTQIS
ncbi:hypothetical protein BGZ75_008023, partial [Mortierella antarctica]